MDIGKNIRQLRLAHNMKQSDLGEKLGITDKAVSSWEHNRTEPNMGMIEKMCAVFDCKKTDIIDGPGVIEDLTGKIMSLSPSDDFITAIQSDSIFMSNIRFLFSLPDEQRSIVYGLIQYLYYDVERKKETTSDA